MKKMLMLSLLSTSLLSGVVDASSPGFIDIAGDFHKVSCIVQDVAMCSKADRCFMDHQFEVGPKPRPPRW